MEISLKTYKQLYKAFLQDNNLDDDSNSVSGIAAKDYLEGFACQSQEDLLELAHIHNIEMVFEETIFCESKDLKSFEIYFDDLNEDAQTRFRDAGLWDENTEMSPLAIFEYEQDWEDEN